MGMFDDLIPQKTRLNVSDNSLAGYRGQVETDSSTTPGQSDCTSSSKLKYGIFCDLVPNKDTDSPPISQESDTNLNSGTVQKTNEGSSSFLPLYFLYEVIILLTLTTLLVFTKKVLNKIKWPRLSHMKKFIPYTARVASFILLLGLFFSGNFFVFDTLFSKYKNPEKLAAGTTLLLSAYFLFRFVSKKDNSSQKEKE